MLVAGEVKGELARIVPARRCCRAAELAGLLASDRPGAEDVLSTFDHGTARIAVQLAASLGIAYSGPHAPASRRGAVRGTRHHLRVVVDREGLEAWSWEAAAACDRRAYLRGLLLATGSISLTSGGPHVEFVIRGEPRAAALQALLRESGVHALMAARRGTWVVYVKGRDQIATLLRLTGANRGLLDFESGRVGSEVGNRLNRLLNAEEANLGRTVRAADRQIQAIRRLDRAGRLERLPHGLRAAAAERRHQPEADLDTLAAALGVSRSAANHRLRRLVELAEEESRPSATADKPSRRTSR